MKEPMTDARRKQLYRIKKRKRRKQCIRVALRMAVLCFLVLFAVQKTADLLRVDDSDRMEDAEQSYSGQGGKTRTNTEKTWGVFGKADVLTQEDKLHSIRPKDYIFKGKDGGAYRGTTFRQEFQQYCDKNGIADGSYIFKTHDYRHTLATQFYDEDVSIQTIRDYLGHFSEEMTKQYVDFMPKRIEKASDTYFKKPENDLASTIKAKKRGERK